MILNLGVDDAVYPEGETTGEVASKLEHEYGVMEIFTTLHSDTIAEKVTELIVANFTSENASAEVNLKPDFQEYLLKGEHTIITKASIGRMGKTDSGLDRVSFIDTGNYADHFRAWVE